MRDLANKNQPNQGHLALIDIQKKFQLKKKIFEVSTQNIDDLHNRALKIKKYIPTNQVYEMHGNAKFMRCLEECHDKIYLSPSLAEVEKKLPTCPNCQALMRPNILLFDESYNEKFYHKETIQNIFDQAQSIMIIGTNLDTQLANRLVGQAQQQQKLILEVNTEPIITHGFAVQGKSEILLPQIAKLVK